MSLMEMTSNQFSKDVEKNLLDIESQKSQKLKGLIESYKNLNATVSYFL